MQKIHLKCNEISFITYCVLSILRSMYSCLSNLLSVCVGGPQTTPSFGDSRGKLTALTIELFSQL